MVYVVQAGFARYWYSVKFLETCVHRLLSLSDSRVGIQRFGRRAILENISSKAIKNFCKCVYSTLSGLWYVARFSSDFVSFWGKNVDHNVLLS